MLNSDVTTVGMGGKTLNGFPDYLKSLLNITNPELRKGDEIVNSTDIQT